MSTEKKTAEDYWAQWSTEQANGYRKMNEAMFKACIRECQADSNQQLAEYKEKLKESITFIYKHDLHGDLVAYDDVLHLIDSIT